jgi:prohibitin 2
VLGKSLGETFLQLDRFLLGEVYLQKEQQDAISAVANAQLQAKQAAFLAEKAENEARAAVAQAEGAKKVRILQAQAEAEAIRTVNEQLANSPKFIEYTYSQKWNGAYPSTVVLANGQSFPIFAGLRLTTTNPAK